MRSARLVIASTVLSTMSVATPALRIFAMVLQISSRMIGAKPLLPRRGSRDADLRAMPVRWRASVARLRRAGRRDG